MKKWCGVLFTVVFLTGLLLGVCPVSADEGMDVDIVVVGDDTDLDVVIDGDDPDIYINVKISKSLQLSRWRIAEPTGGQGGNLESLFSLGWKRPKTGCL